MNKEQISQELQKYNITDAAIQELKQKYSGLKIKGLDDKEGYKLVHDARMDLRDRRVAVEKTRKELKADSLEYGRLVDAEAKRITALLEPLENELAKQEEIFENEKKRIKEEAERKAQEALNVRITELAKYGAAHDVLELKNMPEESFQALLKYHKGLHEAAEEKKCLEAEAAKAEQERIAKEKAELEEKQKAFEKQQAELKAEQDRKDAEIKAAQKKLDDEKAAHEAQIQKEKDDAQAKIKEQHLRALGAQQERERIEREEKEKEAQKALEELKTKRAEALKPDKEKILTFVDSIKSMPFPSVKHDDAKKLMDSFKSCLDKCCESIINESKNL